MKYYNDLKKKMKNLEWFALNFKGMRVKRQLRDGLSLPNKPMIVKETKLVETFKMKSHKNNTQLVDYYLQVIKLNNGENKTIKLARQLGLSQNKSWVAKSELMSIYTFKSTKYLLHIIENPIRMYGHLFQLSNLKTFIRKYGLTETLKFHIFKTFKDFYKTPSLHGALNEDNIHVIHDKGYVFEIKLTDIMKIAQNHSKKLPSNKPVPNIKNMIYGSRKLLINKQIKSGNVKLINKKSPKKYMRVSNGIEFTNNMEVLKMFYPTLYKYL